MASHPIADFAVNAKADFWTNFLQTNFSDGSTLNQTAPSARVAAMQSLKDHIDELVKQHQDSTQAVSYANQLTKLESYIKKKLDVDYRQTFTSTDSVVKTIHQTRQRYIDKASQVYFNWWLVNVFHKSLLFLSVAAFLTIMTMSDALSAVAFTICMVVLSLLFVCWFYGQVGVDAMRDRDNPDVVVWNGASSSSSSCQQKTTLASLIGL